MASAHSKAAGPDAAPARPRRSGPFTAHKILIAGGFGSGKTTLVGAISEVRPLRTEEALTTASVGLDDLSGVDGKTTTTVALDFGRITLGRNVALYLFGLPGQERFSFMWDELSYGALGAVVLADVRRLSDCFPSVNYFEALRLPFVVAINCFDTAPRYDGGGGTGRARPRRRRPRGAVRRARRRLGEAGADHPGGDHFHQPVTGHRGERPWTVTYSRQRLPPAARKTGPGTAGPGGVRAAPRHRLRPAAGNRPGA